MKELKLFRSLPDPVSAGVLDLLERSGLRMEERPDECAVVLEEGRIIATGSRRGGVLQYIAVDSAFEGEGLCESIVSALTESAFSQGIFRLFLFTKPSAAGQFISQGFHVLAETGSAALLENSASAFPEWLASLPRGAGGLTGAIVANLNPLTRGHRALIRRAASECDTLHLFVLSEDRSLFSAEERLEMARRVTAECGNVLVHPGGRYIISAATFPAYFIKDTSRIPTVQAELDAQLFAARIAPALGITRRFVGEEPFDAVTAAYNEALSGVLPRHGIELVVQPRLENISASKVRALLAEGKTDEALSLLPEECHEIARRHAG